MVDSRFLSEAGLSFLRPFEKHRHTGLGPFSKELLLGSKAFRNCLFSLEQVEKDKAGRKRWPSSPRSRLSGSSFSQAGLAIEFHRLRLDYSYCDIIWYRRQSISLKRQPWRLWACRGTRSTSMQLSAPAGRVASTRLSTTFLRGRSVNPGTWGKQRLNKTHKHKEPAPHDFRNSFPLALGPTF